MPGKKNKIRIGAESGDMASVRMTRQRVAAVLEQVWALADPLCASEGLELVHVEFQPEAGGRILRITIDKPRGVTLDDCAAVSRQLSDILDISLENIGPYNLEISSPGPQRPLGRQRDFDRFKGETVKIKTLHPVEGRKNFTGTLAGLSDGIVHLEASGKTIAIPYEDIHRARLISHGEDG